MRWSIARPRRRRTSPGWSRPAGHWNRGGAASQWLEQQATPDGCIEIIRRTRGRSRWNGEQPQPFEISGDAAFEAMRLWPWAWRLIGDIALVTLHGRWQEIPTPDFAAIEARLSAAPDLNRIGAAIVTAPTVAAMGAATDMPPRALQRWFARHVGMPPRAYLRLLRFQGAFETLPGDTSLAGHAADSGFADQAHMARAFRSLAGVLASTARRRARGPFLD